MGTTCERPHRACCALPLLIPLALAGSCASQPASDIDGEDDSFIGAVRVSMPFGDEEESSRDGTRIGVRLDADVSGGEFEQDLFAGQFVRLDTVAFDGPGAVAVEFDHTFAALSLYLENRAGPLRVAGAFGLGGSFLDAEASMAGLSDSATVDSVGLHIGAHISYVVLDPVALFYELQGLFGGGDDDVEIFAAQLGALWTISDHVALSAGYAGWEYSAERQDDPGLDRSDLELYLAGPFLRFELGL